MRSSLAARTMPVVVSTIALAACGCAPGSGVDGPVPAPPLADGDFEAATTSLRALAADCENGERGRQAVLVRALLELDPRNTGGAPDSAARLTARYLQLPDADPAGVSSAEAIYLMALDRGAVPVSDPLAYQGIADRFSDCDGAPPIRAARLRELPDHPGTPVWRAQLLTERMLDALQASADSLRAELERIRRALGQPVPRP